MSRPAGFDHLEEGWAALTEALAAAGVNVDEVTARHAAKAVVVDTMQRGWVVSHTDHARTIRAEVDAAVRPLREQLRGPSPYPLHGPTPEEGLARKIADEYEASQRVRLSGEVTHR